MLSDDTLASLYTPDLAEFEAAVRRSVPADAADRVAADARRWHALHTAAVTAAYQPYRLGKGKVGGGRFAKKGDLGIDILRKLLRGNGSARKDAHTVFDKKLRAPDGWGRGDLTPANLNVWATKAFGPRPQGTDGQAWDAGRRELGNYLAAIPARSRMPQAPATGGGSNVPGDAPDAPSPWRDAPKGTKVESSGGSTWTRKYDGDSPYGDGTDWVVASSTNNRPIYAAAPPADAKFKSAPDGWTPRSAEAGGGNDMPGDYTIATDRGAVIAEVSRKDINDPAPASDGPDWDAAEIGTEARHNGPNGPEWWKKVDDKAWELQDTEDGEEQVLDAPPDGAEIDGIASTPMRDDLRGATADMLDDSDMLGDPTPEQIAANRAEADAAMARATGNVGTAAENAAPAPIPATRQAPAPTPDAVGSRAEADAQMAQAAATGNAAPRAQAAPQGDGSRENPFVTDDVAQAAAWLAEDKHVRLNSVEQVSTLLDKLHAEIQSIKDAGGTAPNINLCNVSVPGTNLFCAENVGKPRIQMPQLSGKPLPGSPADSLPKDPKGGVDLGPLFIEHLKSRGIMVTEKSYPASHLRASQNELLGNKVLGMMKSVQEGRMGPARIFTSRDQYVVDGHHRWAANVGADLDDGELGGLTQDVNEVDADILDVLAMANAFALQMGIPQADMAQNDGGGGHIPNIQPLDVPEAGTGDLPNAPGGAAPDGPEAGVSNDMGTFSPIPTADGGITVPMTDDDFTAMSEYGSASAHIVGRNPDGSPIFTPERQALHRKIVEELTAGVQPSDNPIFYMLGGGPAAGKSTMLGDPRVEVPGEGEVVTIDSDAIKGKLPEYQQMVADGDGSAASFAHEESSYLAKLVMGTAFDQNLPTLLDGTGNSSSKSVQKKIDAAHDAGYRVSGMYATVPTQVAIDRADARAAETGRVVPHSVIEGTHASVSAIFPELAEMFDDLMLFENSDGPKLIAEAHGPGTLQVVDQGEYDSFLAKGDSSPFKPKPPAPDGEDVTPAVNAPEVGASNDLPQRQRTKMDPAAFGPMPIPKGPDAPLVAEAPPDDPTALRQTVDAIKAMTDEGTNFAVQGEAKKALIRTAMGMQMQAMYLDDTPGLEPLPFKEGVAERDREMLASRRVRGNGLPVTDEDRTLDSAIAWLDKAIANEKAGVAWPDPEDEDENGSPQAAPKVEPIPNIPADGMPFDDAEEAVNERLKAAGIDPSKLDVSYPERPGFGGTEAVIRAPDTETADSIEDVLKGSGLDYTRRGNVLSYDGYPAPAARTEVPGQGDLLTGKPIEQRTATELLDGDTSPDHIREVLKRGDLTDAQRAELRRLLPDSRADAVAAALSIAGRAAERRRYEAVAAALELAARRSRPVD